MNHNWRHLSYVIFPLISNKVTCVSCLLVVSEMLGSAFKMLTENLMDSSHNRQKFLQRLPTQLSSKQKNISQNFYCIFEIYIKFWAFWKKRSPSYLQYFPSYCFQKMLLLECWKAPVSELPLELNVLSGPKHW